MKHSGANLKNEDTTSPDDERTRQPQRLSKSHDPYARQNASEKAEGVHFNEENN
jgi:hypothetical protein